MLEEQDTFEDLYEYFYQINYILEQGNEYFYFSRIENTVDLERKLEKAFNWIDILDFFKTFDSSFDVGYRFSPADIVNQLKNNADLKTKLDSLKKISGDKNSYTDRIKKIIDKLEKDNFITLENEISETYKVLTSFNYLKDIISTINIPEEKIGLHVFQANAAIEEPALVPEEIMDSPYFWPVVIGGAVLIVFIIALIIFLIVRKKRKQKVDREDINQQIKSFTELAKTRVNTIKADPSKATINDIQQFADENPEIAANLIREMLKEDEES